ncbi:MAG: TRAP transporter substrate-binding protein [Planctomycetota bacterium]|jgi:tripartite ATP-independent transporter DctP family solute receptor|nr:TRAP transporter substrate-binding protein [Planctomycetota bacterium]
MKRFVFAVLFAVALAAIAAAGQVTLRLGNNQPETQVWNVGIRQLQDAVARHSGGRLEIVNYPNATLGAEPELAESCKEGTLDMFIGDPTVGTTFCKELELFALPFLFRDYDHWLKALDGAPGKKYAELIEQKTGLKILAYWGGSARQVISVRREVRTIGDLRGFKLRLAPSKLKTDVWKAIGTLPVTIAFGETYSAMASGLCDGMENELPAILANKLYEPAKNLTLTEHEITVRPMFINADVFNGLDKDIQEALAKAMAEVTPVARKLEQEAGDTARAEMTGKFDVKVFEIDKNPIIQATAGVFREFGESTGLIALIKEFQDFK